MKELSPQEALHKLAAYCSKAERCRSDLMRKLSEWNIDPNEGKAIIDRLTSEKFVDEERYCRFFIREKIRTAKWGERKIAYALQQKGIASALYADQLSEELRNTNHEELLYRLLLSKNKTIRNENPFERRNKLIRFALSRGFTMTEIQKNLARLSQIPSDDE